MLLKREESNEYRVYDSDFEDKYDLLEVSYNTELLNDEGYIVCDSVQTMYFDENNRPTPLNLHIIYRLTSKGHDYLDSVRNDSIYSKTKQKIASLGTSLALPLIRNIAESLIKDQLGI